MHPSPLTKFHDAEVSFAPRKLQNSHVERNGQHHQYAKRRTNGTTLEVTTKKLPDGDARTPNGDRPLRTRCARPKIRDEGYVSKSTWQRDRGTIVCRHELYCTCYHTARPFTPRGRRRAYLSRGIAGGAGVQPALSVRCLVRRYLC